MKSAKSADALREKLETIVNAAKGQGLVVFYGWAHGTDQKLWTGTGSMEEIGRSFWNVPKRLVRECFTLIGHPLRNSKSMKRSDILKGLLLLEAEQASSNPLLYPPAAR
jgi:hypothetical protein